MRGPRPTVAALACLAASLAAATALAGNGQEHVRGARYTFLASSAYDRAAGSGAFDRKTEAGGNGNVTVTRRGTRIQARVRTWKLTLLGAQATLVLRIEVTSSSSPAACPIGTKGVTTLVDEGGDATGDRVRIAFPGGRCRALARSWSAASPGARIRVKVTALYAARSA